MLLETEILDAEEVSVVDQNFFGRGGIDPIAIILYTLNLTILVIFCAMRLLGKLTKSFVLEQSLQVSFDLIHHYGSAFERDF